MMMKTLGNLHIDNAVRLDQRYREYLVRTVALQSMGAIYKSLNNVLRSLQGSIV